MRRRAGAFARGQAGVRRIPSQVHPRQIGGFEPPAHASNGAEGIPCKETGSSTAVIANFMAWRREP
jgi:hypothetical protein